MKTKDLVFISISAAILCITAPLSINIGTIPFTLAIFVLVVIGILFKPWHSFLIVLLYIIIGAIGLPVFSSFRGGVSVLLGVTGGYLVGYIPLVLIISFVANSNSSILKLIIFGIIGLITCYICGFIWFMIETKSSFATTFTLTVAPFIIPDLIKIVIASVIGKKLQSKLKFK